MWFHFMYPQLDCISCLFESGFAVNGDLESGQSPAHLAACGGQAFCLMWLLQTGADANQQVLTIALTQRLLNYNNNLPAATFHFTNIFPLFLKDASGETPMHKAARAGSAECISVLMASDAKIE